MHDDYRAQQIILEKISNFTAVFWRKCRISRNFLLLFEPPTPLTYTKTYLRYLMSLAVIFTARCYASAVLAMALCPSVCPSVRPSVRPSQVGVLLKRLNVGSHRQHRTIAQGIYFSEAKGLRKLDRYHPLLGRQMQVGWVKIGDF